MTEQELKEVNGLFDMIKSALPTIGKVAMQVIGGLVNETGNGKAGLYTVVLNASEKCVTEAIHFVNKDGRIIAVNTSLTQSITLNFPRKADHIGMSVSLGPFSFIDITDDMSSSAKANAQRFSITNATTEQQASDGNGGSGVMSCLGYFTKKMLARPFYLNSHILLQMVGQSLQIKMSAGLELKAGEALTLGTSAGGELKRFNSLNAVSDNTENADASTSSTYLLLDNALADYSEDDELELIGDLAFENVRGLKLDVRRGQPLTPDIIQILSDALN